MSQTEKPGNQRQSAPPPLSRRTFTSGLLALPLAGSFSLQTAQASGPGPGGLADSKGDFDLSGICLNGASMHPVSRGAAQAMIRYVEQRAGRAPEPPVTLGANRDKALREFAGLCNADLDELAWVPTTTAGENLVVAGLGLPNSRQRVVSDEYHFEGSLYLYSELAKRGLDFHLVRARNQRIDLNDIERAITPGTRLVALTLVSNVYGFQHDLKAVCDIAHARGALVYADIIQAAGAGPLDLHASGVDFAACATYKWLMGDFGAAFLYARRDSQQYLQPSQWGYRSGSLITHFAQQSGEKLPLLESRPNEGLAGIVGVGTISHSARTALAHSLPYLRALGMEAIDNWRQPLLAMLQERMPAMGFTPLTPPESRAAIVAFAMKGAARQLQAPLEQAGIDVSVYENHLRISPSFFNDRDDIEQLLEVISRALAGKV
ncbi:aminotransferase class V-fold PLP-dependent enzyme [Parahaliea aestuarii]|uniref:Aminotransferase class V-fold PLP-dependent enzyme n=1 Tax=Parahaliea aestuarii TaxID=1852021 RepID=A0A5C8ZSW1_9GAMM|nr:aminotransferase class V-fold PLP-dependent enzyme [Parahaliea aestuarii]TXS91546.1 aminotransferase class V-fold PLP-dependent enzyme [Parahaliea aestuarii]